MQEKRIYDLKKKNQELEKFKFVLDYKIKELKKQIEPRENDIKNMKEQIQEVSFQWIFSPKQNENNRQTWILPLNCVLSSYDECIVII